MSRHERRVSLPVPLAPWFVGPVNPRVFPWARQEGTDVTVHSAIGRLGAGGYGRARRAPGRAPAYEGSTAVLMLNGEFGEHLPDLATALTRPRWSDFKWVLAARHGSFQNQNGYLVKKWGARRVLAGCSPHWRGLNPSRSLARARVAKFEPRRQDTGRAAVSCEGRPSCPGSVTAAKGSAS